VNRRLRAALAVRAGPPQSQRGRLRGAEPTADSSRSAVTERAAVPGPLVLDLIAALVQGGAPPPVALRMVGEALHAAGDARGPSLLMAAARVSRPGSDVGTDRLTMVVEAALGLAARSGLPPTALIRRSAAEERRRQAAAQIRAVRRLEVLLVIPAGLCLLPAFVLLGIVPVVLDLLLG